MEDSLKRKKRRVAAGELLERNHLLEVENQRLRLRISNLREEVRWLEELKKTNSDQEHLPLWVEGIINESLACQVSKHNVFEKECYNVMRMSESITQRGELMHSLKLNGLFLLEKMELLRSINADVVPLDAPQSNPKRTALYKGMLKACLRLYAMSTGCVAGAPVEVNEILNWRPDLNFEANEITYKCSHVRDTEKWVSVQIVNYPVAKEKLIKILNTIDVLSLGMMGSSAAQAFMSENASKIQNHHTVGHTNAIVPVNIYGTKPQCEVFNLQLCRPIELQSEDLAFIYAAGKYGDTYSYTQSLLPKSSSDLETLEKKGAFFMRGMTLTSGEVVDGLETSNLSIVIGMKQPSSWLGMEDFLTALRLTGGNRFMEHDMHAQMKVLNMFEALFKTAAFVYGLHHEQYQPPSVVTPLEL